MSDKKERKLARTNIPLEKALTLPTSEELGFSGHFIREDGTTRNIRTKEEPDFLLTGSKSNVRVSNPYGMGYNGYAANELTTDITTEITDFERQLLEKIRRISYSSDEEQQLLSVVDRTINSIAKSRLPRIESAPVLWADRNKSEKAHEFIMRVYGEYVEAGALFRSDLRRLDPPLNMALQRQEENKNPAKHPPASFYLPKQQDSLTDDPSVVIKGGKHEGRQASGTKTHQKT